MMSSQYCLQYFTAQNTQIHMKVRIILKDIVFNTDENPYLK